MRLCIAFLPLVLIGAVASPPAVDGLRLGMTSTEVLGVLHARGETLHVNPKPCLSELIAQHKKIVSTNTAPGRCTDSIIAHYAGGSLLLLFDEALPERPGTSVLTTIALNFPTDSSTISRVVAQSGPPALTDGKNPWVVAMWCFGFTCHDMNKVLQDPMSGPVLGVNRRAGLALDDRAVETRYLNALYAALARHGIKIDNK